MPVPINEETIADLQEDWEADMPLADMAVKHGYANAKSLRTRISYLRGEGYIFEPRKNLTSAKERAKLDKAVKALVDQGKSRPDIATSLGCSLHSVSNAIARLNKKSKKPIATGKRHSQETIDKLIELYRAKTPLADIASILGFVSPAEVSNTLSRLRRRGVVIPYNRGR